MKTSSLASKADRSTQHLRWAKDTDGWGGDEDVVLASIDTFQSRLEQVEGVGEAERWNVWVFDSTTDLQIEDILLYTSPDLALVIQKIAPFTRLKGGFHHWELLTEEHEQPYAQLLAALP